MRMRKGSVREAGGKRAVLRSGFLVIAGIAILAILNLIQSGVSALWQQQAIVLSTPIACELPLDLGKVSRSESAFVAYATRQFELFLRLRTSLPDPSNPSILPESPMEDVLRGETLRLSWEIDNEGRTVADGVITGVDLKERVVSRDIS